jgi:hypothetical protein
MYVGNPFAVKLFAYLIGLHDSDTSLAETLRFRGDWTHSRAVKM